MLQMHDKPTLRQYMRGRLRGMEESERRSAATQIACHILSVGIRVIGSHIFRSCLEETAAPGIALFGGLKNEPDLLLRLMPALIAQGFNTCVFQIEPDRLLPCKVRTMDDLQRGSMNVWEPKPHCASVEISALDIILVPGLAFTRGGLRLGRGGGYYDRLLAHTDCRARRIGIAYDLQIIDDIPVEPHDQRVHQIITESGLIQPSASPAPH